MGKLSKLRYNRNLLLLCDNKITLKLLKCIQVEFFFSHTNSCTGTVIVIIVRLGWYECRLKCVCVCVSWPQPLVLSTWNMESGRKREEGRDERIINHNTLPLDNLHVQTKPCPRKKTSVMRAQQAGPPRVHKISVEGLTGLIWTELVRRCEFVCHPASGEGGRHFESALLKEWVRFPSPASLLSMASLRRKEPSGWLGWFLWHFNRTVLIPHLL